MQKDTPMHGLLENDSQTWRPLRHFNYYRFGLAIAFSLFFYNASLDGVLGSSNPEAYLATCSLFFASSLIYIFAGLKQKPTFESQVVLANSSDILFITLLMHFSGGLVSTLGMFLIINIAATGTFLSSRKSFFFASLATIAVLSEHSYSLLHSSSTNGSYTTAGILGMVFFASSMLASTLRIRLLESEAIANQKTADLINLEKLNEHIIQNMRTGILVVSEDGHIHMANSSAEALLGNISLKSNPLLKNALPELEKRFIEWHEQPQMHHSAIPQKQGLPDIQPGFQQFNNISGKQSNTIIFLEDASQLNQRFQQIKLASLGQLTASIAHEIRNPLSAINHASQLLNESELSESDTKLTKIINTQVQRLDKIINNVLELSRQKASLPEVINLPNWLNNFKEEFCSALSIPETQLILVFKSERLDVLFDSSHLYQVMTNLCNNAISHSDKDIQHTLIKIVCNYDLKVNQAYLEIQDNGPGIDPELAQQIFDPFFTTSSKGSGLGLYISKEIIEINRAKIQYMDNNKAGSCFRIYFLSASNK